MCNKYTFFHIESLLEVIPTLLVDLLTTKKEEESDIEAHVDQL